MLNNLKTYAETQPEKLFLNNINYRQALIQIVTMAGKLNGRFAQTRLAFLPENTTDSVVALFALLLLEKEVLLLNPELTAHEIDKQAAALGITDILRPVDLYCLSVREETRPTLHWSPADDKIALLVNTSATSGAYKTVPITWGMIQAQTEASAARLGVETDDNWLLLLPLFHVSGLSILMRTLYNGTALTLLPHFDEAVTLELIESGAITLASLVPTMLKRLIGRLERHRLRVILLGGEFIPQALVMEALAKQLPIYKTYGMTETFSQVATFGILDFPDKLSAAGRALPGVQLEIRQADSEGIGEIWLNSPTLMAGYLGKPALTDGYLTGDIGRLDADGFLYVYNRRSDLIVSGGENIYPKEIEDLLYERPDVIEAAVLPQEDPVWGQVPILYITSSASENELHNYLASRLAKYKLPQRIVFKEQLPRTASGKIARKALQA